MLYSQDIPFWSGTFDLYCMQISIHTPFLHCGFCSLLHIYGIDIERRNFFHFCNYFIAPQNNFTMHAHMEKSHEKPLHERTDTPQQWVGQIKLSWNPWQNLNVFYSCLFITWQIFRYKQINLTAKTLYISRIPDQNGISPPYNMLEPSI